MCPLGQTTMRQNENYILNYNSNNRKFHTNWGELFSHLGKKCALTSAQNLHSNSLFRTLFLLLLMVMSTVGVWAQITPTTDTSNPVYYLIQNYQNTALYMKPYVKNNTTYVTTSNSLTDDMKWFFLDAGDNYY